MGHRCGRTGHRQASYSREWAPLGLQMCVVKGVIVWSLCLIQSFPGWGMSVSTRRTRGKAGQTLGADWPRWEPRLLSHPHPAVASGDRVARKAPGTPTPGHTSAFLSPSIPISTEPVPGSILVPPLELCLIPKAYPYPEC